jgi:hypothetical protein
MTFQEKYDLFNGMCQEMAENRFENREIIARYKKYQQTIENIREQYKNVLEDVSEEYIEKLVNEKIQSMQKAGQQPICYGYVSKDRKEEILKLVANGRNEVSYRELQDYIRSKGVGATTGSFFRDQVKRYKKVGGNKNKRLILTN